MKKDKDYFVGDEEEPEESKKENVGPTFDDVTRASMRPTEDGTPAIVLSELSQFEGRYGYNGGRGCDVASGPCSCGAWHDESENKQLNPDWVARHKSSQK